MQWGVATCLLALNVTTAAALTPFTVATVNACLGSGLASDGYRDDLHPRSLSTNNLHRRRECFDYISRQVLDGSILSVNATLSSPSSQSQLSINNTAHSQYGRLYTATSGTLDVFGRASSDSEAVFEDVITISYAPLNGQPGLLSVSYSLSGNGSSLGQNTSFARTQVIAGTSLEQRYSAVYSSSTWGLFYLPQPIKFTYGVPFGLEFVLATTNSFGAVNDGTGSGTATLVDSLILSGLMPADQFGNPVKGAQFSSASGTQYGPNGVAPNSGQTPSARPPLISSLQPASGPAGTLVTVSGTGFTPTAGGTMGKLGGGGDYGGNTVDLGSDVTLQNLNSADGVTVQFEIPQNVRPGIYSLSIVNENGASNAVNLTVTGN